MPNKNKNPDYIKEFKEWQDHQYQPGYFVGGKIPIWMREPGNPKLLAAIYLLPAVIIIISLIYNLVSGNSLSGWDDIPGDIVGGVILILSMLFGIKLLVKK